MIRILLLQHQRLDREGTARLMGAEPDMKVVAETANLEEATALVGLVRADVVVADFDMPGLTAQDVSQAVRRVEPLVRIVGLCARWSDTLIAEALEAQILGFALKQEGYEPLRDAIRAAYRHEYHYTAGVTDRVVTEEGNPNPKPKSNKKTRLQLLTPRERQLLRLLASGMSLKAACRRLHVTYKTGDKHKVNLMRKLKIHDRVELARYAIRENLVEP